MNCPICKTDISLPEQQFGSVRTPVCQSCFLSDNAWAVEDEEILELLQRNFTLQEACYTVQANFMKELEKELSEAQ